MKVELELRGLRNSGFVAALGMTDGASPLAPPKNLTSGAKRNEQTSPRGAQLKNLTSGAKRNELTSLRGAQLKNLTSGAKRNELTSLRGAQLKNLCRAKRYEQNSRRGA
jgi:hypothetical protein